LKVKGSLSQTTPLLDPMNNYKNKDSVNIQLFDFIKTKHKPKDF